MKTGNCNAKVGRRAYMLAGGRQLLVSGQELEFALGN